MQVGGQAAIAGHLRIGQGARIGAQAGVMSDVPPGAAAGRQPRPAPARVLPAGGRPEADGAPARGVTPLRIRAAHRSQATSIARAAAVTRVQHAGPQDVRLDRGDRESASIRWKAAMCGASGGPTAGPGCRESLPGASGRARPPTLRRRMPAWRWWRRASCRCGMRRSATPKRVPGATALLTPTTALDGEALELFQATEAARAEVAKRRRMPGGHRRRCDPHPRNPSLGAGRRGGSAGRCGSHAGRSAEGARIRGDGRDPKLGRRSAVPAVGSSSAAHAASAGSAASKTRDAAGRVAGCAIAAILAGAHPHRNGGRGRSRSGGRARLDCPAHPCPRDEHRTPKTACRRTSSGSS